MVYRCSGSCFLPPIFASLTGLSLPHHGSLPPDEPDRDALRGCWPGGRDSHQRGGCHQKARNKTRSLQRRYPQHWSGGQKDRHEKEEVGLAKNPFWTCRAVCVFARTYVRVGDFSNLKILTASVKTTLYRQDLI